MMITRRRRPLVQALLLIVAVSVLPGVISAQESKGRSNWTWTQSDDGKKIEVQVENKVEFNDDYSDVAAIPGDGMLRIIDSRGTQTLKLLIMRGANGELRRDYSIDGQSHVFDDQGRAWLGRVLLQAAREGGLDARNRVKRILEQRGTSGLVEEISHVKGDYVRRLYFEEFLQDPGLGENDLKTALRNASLTINGDYERAQLLLQVGNVFLARKELVANYFEALDKLKSGYEHHRVLKGVLKREDLSLEALAMAARSASKIDSDYEKATFLVKAAHRYQGRASLRTEWLGALQTVGSDYEHHRALRGALQSGDLNIEDVLSLVESAARLRSDYEKASFLIEALDHYKPDARLRAAFISTAKTIDSEYERGRVQKRMDRVDF